VRNFLEKNRIALAGVAGALLVLCILAGAFLVGPLVASAHGSTNTTSAKKDTTYCDQYNQALAKRLGISVDTLKQDRQGAFEDVLAQMVKDGKLTQAEADQIKQREEKGAQNGCPGFGTGNFAGIRNSLLKKYGPDLVTQVAQGLHLTSDQLTTQLQSGKSLTDIAQAQGISADALHSMVNNAITSELNKAVSAGDITQNQATAFTTYLQKHPQFLDHVLDQHKHTGKGKK
jgi:polyhydroxyalkanoate synthesis regulator phasin